ncbi:MAG: galactokinase [Metamycoplasmataceae bacterium]
MDKIQKNLVKTHKKLYKTKPEVTILTPSRINIIGEHIDYLGGNVLPANINLYMLGLFSKNDDIEIFSENYKNEGVKKIKNQEVFQYDESQGFLNFVLGCIQVLRNNNYKINGASITIYSSIPSGSGLSSSAAFGVLIIKGLLTLYGYKVDGVDIAKLFKEVENNFMNLKNGIMDQFIIANGIKDHLMLLNTSTLNFSNYKIDLGDFEFVVFNTKKRRELIDSKYNERVDETSRGLQQINKTNNYKNLVSIPLNELNEKLKLIDDEIIKKRVKYAVEEQDRVNRFIESLNNNEYFKMGQILNEGHNGLKNLYEVSCDELDFIVERANEISGVLGARMTGAGFGGCCIVLTHKDEIKELEKFVIKNYEEKFGYPCEMYIIKVVDSAKNID